MSGASGTEGASRSSLVTPVASAASRESFAQAGAFAVGTGQAVVDIDTFRVDARICLPTLHLPDLL